jgi:hypothetical protein
VWLHVAAEHEHVSDIPMPLGLAVVRRIDSEVVEGVTWMDATSAREGMRVAGFRSDDVEV